MSFREMVEQACDARDLSAEARTWARENAFGVWSVLRRVEYARGVLGIKAMPRLTAADAARNLAITAQREAARGVRTVPAG